MKVWERLFCKTVCYTCFGTLLICDVDTCWTMLNYCVICLFLFSIISIYACLGRIECFIFKQHWAGDLIFSQRILHDIKMYSNLVGWWLMLQSKGCKRAWSWQWKRSQVCYHGVSGDINYNKCFLLVVGYDLP